VTQHSAEIPVIGGVCVGGMAIITPQVLAAGHGAMVLDLHRQMATDIIAMVIVLKLIACLVSLASGFRGGLFFASLLLGALGGRLFADAFSVAWPALALDARRNNRFPAEARIPNVSR